MDLTLITIVVVVAVIAIIGGALLFAWTAGSNNKHGI